MAATVEVITSVGCENSPKALRLTRQVERKVGHVAVYEVNTVSEAARQYANMFEVKNTPAFVVNGKVEYAGMPAEKKLVEIFELAR